LEHFLSKALENIEVEPKKIADALYIQAPVSNGTVLFIASLFFFLFDNYSDSPLHSAWSFLMVLVATYRLILWYQRKHNSASQTDSYWLNHYIFGSALVGFSWGGIFLLPHINHDEILYGALLMFFFGVTASVVSVLSVSLKAFFGYTLPIVISFILSIINLNIQYHLYFVTGILAYYIMVSLFAINTNKQIIASIILQFQNESLIKQLRQEIRQRESLIKARTIQLEQSNQQILCSEDRLQKVIMGAELGYWDWNYQTGHHEVNDRWLEILGLTRDDIENDVSDWEALIHPEDRQRISDTVTASIEHHQPYVTDFRMKHKNGNWIWIQGSGSLIESDESTLKPLRLCGILQDISFRKKLEKELEYRAKHDPLTRLYNRIELEKHFQSELIRAKRYQHNLSIFMIDIDHFKQINDTSGHHFGDQVLIQFSNLMKETVRSTDYVARYGGEEFIIILHETDLNEAEELAERLRIKTENKVFKTTYKTSTITISIGIASYPKDANSFDELLKLADSAMYQAKNCGRNCVRISCL